MALEAPGRHIRRTASKLLTINTPVVEGNLVGWVTQRDGELPTFTDPSSASVAQIQIGDDYTQAIGGTHELALTGGLSGAVVGEKLWIHPADNSVHLAGTAVAGDLPLGIVESIDAARTPDVALVNLNDLRSFMAHA